MFHQYQKINISFPYLLSSFSYIFLYISFYYISSYFTKQMINLHTSYTMTTLFSLYIFYVFHVASQHRNFPLYCDTKRDASFPAPLSLFFFPFNFLFKWVNHSPLFSDVCQYTHDITAVSKIFFTSAI